MATTNETKRRATKNLDLELQRYQEFCTNIMCPVLVDVQLSTTEYRVPMTATVVEIAETYGHSLSKAFALMFKRLAKNKVREDGQRDGSLWLPYPKALAHYAKWNETTSEKTGRSLLEYLEGHGVQEMTWNPALKKWLSADIVRAIKECNDDNDKTDYAALYKSLTTTHATEVTQ
jgi:hypothetical protein